MAGDTAALGSLVAGKYHLRKLLAVGGMGRVYEAVHQALGKRVAIKIIDPSWQESSERVLRFRREARAASSVESEHIVQVFDVGVDPVAGLYLVMELLRGEDLEARLARERSVDVASAVAIGIQAARGLSRAHAVGVIHRDLKPANLFLTAHEDGNLLVKVLDFGISKLIATNGASGSRDGLGLTQAGMLMGTPQYMSPEQIHGSRTIDQRTDVWSLGCVLYEALAGRPAYAMHAQYEQTLYGILAAAPASLREVAPSVPEAVADVVHAAIEHDLAKRIGDCSALARRLAAALPRISVRASTAPVEMGAQDQERFGAELEDPMAHTVRDPSSPNTVRLHVGTLQMPEIWASRRLTTHAGAASAQSVAPAVRDGGSSPHRPITWGATSALVLALFVWAFAKAGASPPSRADVARVSPFEDVTESIQEVTTVIGARALSSPAPAPPHTGVEGLPSMPPRSLLIAPGLDRSRRPAAPAQDTADPAASLASDEDAADSGLDVSVRAAMPGIEESPIPY